MADSWKQIHGNNLLLRVGVCAHFFVYVCVYVRTWLCVCVCVCVQVMLVIDAAVSHLDDLHTLEDFLLNLGKKHQAVGVNTQSFAVRLLSLWSLTVIHYCHTVCTVHYTTFKKQNLQQFINLCQYW